ncbi:hypothetical protein GGI07_003557 [Coemansia sp. Benny D115]|nr:hypothetical protein GGI07_003557 [Coemansia sp. Benny D115]
MADRSTTGAEALIEDELIADEIQTFHSFNASDTPSPPSLTQLLERHALPPLVQRTQLVRDNSVMSADSSSSVTALETTAQAASASETIQTAVGSAARSSLQNKRPREQQITASGSGSTSRIGSTGQGRGSRSDAQSFLNGESDGNDSDGAFQPPKAARHAVDQHTSFFPAQPLPDPQHQPQPQQHQPSNTSIEADGGESSSCPICLDAWGISGAHRIVSLKCGHLFGQSCVRKWLRQAAVSRNGQAGKGKCPECNQPAALRDLRPIFARALVAVDDESLQSLRVQVSELQNKLYALESDLAHHQLKHAQMRNEVVRCRAAHQVTHTRCQELEAENMQLRARRCGTHDDSISAPCLTATLQATVPVATLPGESTRILTADIESHVVYATLVRRQTKQHTMIWLDVRTPQHTRLIDPPLHREEIRGAQISPLTDKCSARYLLTASMDQTVALTTIAHQTAAGSDLAPCEPTLATRIAVGAQAWACAWDPRRTGRFYVGTTAGRVLAYSLSHTQSACDIWDGPKSGAVDNNTADSVRVGLSPIHTIVAIPYPCPSKENINNEQEEEGTCDTSRLVAANSQGAYLLPIDPNGPWVLLTRLDTSRPLCSESLGTFHAAYYGISGRNLVILCTRGGFQLPTTLACF